MMYDYEDVCTLRARVITYFLSNSACIVAYLGGYINRGRLFLQQIMNCAFRYIPLSSLYII